MPCWQHNLMYSNVYVICYCTRCINSFINPPITVSMNVAHEWGLSLNNCTWVPKLLILLAGSLLSDRVTVQMQVSQAPVPDMCFGE